MSKASVLTILVIGTLTASCDGSSPGASSSFEVVRDGQKQRYDSTRIALNERDSQLVLWAWNTRDPIPDAADDEYSDGLRVVFDKDALDELASDEVRVEGDVPCTDNLHQFYELTLVFEQSYGDMGPDAGADAEGAARASRSLDPFGARGASFHRGLDVHVRNGYCSTD